MGRFDMRMEGPVVAAMGIAFSLGIETGKRILAARRM